VKLCTARGSGGPLRAWGSPVSSRDSAPVTKAVQFAGVRRVEDVGGVDLDGLSVGAAQPHRAHGIRVRGGGHRRVLQQDGEAVRVAVRRQHGPQHGQRHPRLEAQAADPAVAGVERRAVGHALGRPV